MVGEQPRSLAHDIFIPLDELLPFELLTRGDEPHSAPSATVPRLPWRSGTAWLLVAIFALMGSAYYGLNAWLPDAYSERGWTDGEAGVLLAMSRTARLQQSRSPADSVFT